MLQPTGTRTPSKFCCIIRSVPLLGWNTLTCFWHKMYSILVMLFWHCYVFSKKSMIQCSGLREAKCGICYGNSVHQSRNRTTNHVIETFYHLEAASLLVLCIKHHHKIPTNLLQWDTEYSQKLASYSLSTTENKEKVKRKQLEDRR